jgi:hypothetical protein
MPRRPLGGTDYRTVIRTHPIVLHGRRSLINSMGQRQSV